MALDVTGALEHVIPATAPAAPPHRVSRESGGEGTKDERCRTRWVRDDSHAAVFPRQADGELLSGKQTAVASTDDRSQAFAGAREARSLSIARRRGSGLETRYPEKAPLKGTDDGLFSGGALTGEARSTWQQSSPGCFFRLRLGGVKQAS